MIQWLADVVLAVRLRVRPPQAVLWGGRPGIDRQIGSWYDLRLAAFERRIAATRHARKQMAGMLGLQITLRDAATPALKQADAALRKFSAAMAEEQKRQLRAAGSLGRALQALQRPPDERS